MNNIDRRTVLGLSLAAFAPVGWAETNWPSRPITLMLGFPAGGPNDLVARAMAQRLSEQLKQPMVVE
ncbi:MAG: transporter substrate-binding protein, partial [Variovorax sp.]|nr:transporter substrate-binding protein [Variovorax sp.]